MPLLPPRFPLIDGFEFAAAGGSMRGTWPAGAFPRLRDLLHDEAGTVEVELHGARDVQGRLCLALRVTGMLRLSCRRCLEAVSVPVHENATLWLARAQEEIDAQPLTTEGSDGVVASGAMAVRDLVEDELLLALPYAPRHDSCLAREDAAPGERRTPFAGLRGLLRGNRH